MPFQPWKFFRNPPPTVPIPQAVPSSTSTGSVVTSGSGPSNSSRATNLATSLANLAGTADYLQAVILSLTKGLGVTVNQNSNPDLARALSAVYGSVPPAISVQMYSYTLDVEYGAQQVMLAAGPDSSVQPNPFQNQAVLTINKAVESTLGSQSDFSSQIALMLRNLKTQSIVYNQWQTQLSSYPAASSTPTVPVANAIQASSVDVGDDVNTALSTHIDQMSSTYASAFNMLASPSSVSQDISCMVNTFASLTTAQLAQVKSLFNLVKDTDVTESIQDVSNGLTSFVFVQMMSQASSMVFQLDRVGQMMLGPLGSMNNSLGTGLSAVRSQSQNGLVGVIRDTTQTARVTSGVLSGLLSSNSAASSCGASPSQPASTPAPSPSCSTSAPSSSSSVPGLSLGMSDLSSLLDFSLSKANNKINSSLAAFQKLMSRMQSDTCNQVKLMTVTNNLGTLSSLASAFLSQQQSAGGTTSSAQTQLATVGSILSATVSGNGTTYTVQNGVISVIPPTLPAPTPSAATILSQTGVQTSLSGISQSL